MLYGKEIWGWANDGRMDGIKRKYVKWILGLGNTELYISREKN